MYELVAEEKKIICAVFLNFTDAASLVIMGLSYMFITHDATKFIQFVSLLQTFFSIVYIFVMPESPVWLLT